MTIPKITPYSGGVANPDGSQTQTEFTQNMFNQLSYEANLAPSLNNTVDGINDTATQVDANATSAAQSASAAEAAASGLNYKGLWPDTGGSANKGDTYQTQVGGTPTGEYYTALQNTSVDPVGDNVNWKVNIGKKDVADGDSQLSGGVIYPESSQSSASSFPPNNEVPLGTRYLRDADSGFIYELSQTVNGTIDSINFQKGEATINGVDIKLFKSTAATQKYSITQHPLWPSNPTQAIKDIVESGFICDIGTGLIIEIDQLISDVDEFILAGDSTLKWSDDQGGMRVTDFMLELTSVKRVDFGDASFDFNSANAYAKPSYTPFGSDSFAVLVTTETSEDPEQNPASDKWFKWNSGEIKNSLRSAVLIKTATTSNAGFKRIHIGDLYFNDSCSELGMQINGQHDYITCGKFIIEDPLGRLVSGNSKVFSTTAEASSGRRIRSLTQDSVSCRWVGGAVYFNQNVDSIVMGSFDSRQALQKRDGSATSGTSVTLWKIDHALETVPVRHIHVKSLICRDSFVTNPNAAFKTLFWFDEGGLKDCKIESINTDMDVRLVGGVGSVESYRNSIDSATIYHPARMIMGRACNADRVDIVGSSTPTDAPHLDMNGKCRIGLLNTFNHCNVRLFGEDTRSESDIIFSSGNLSSDTSVSYRRSDGSNEYMNININEFFGGVFDIKPTVSGIVQTDFSDFAGFFTFTSNSSKIQAVDDNLWRFIIGFDGVLNQPDLLIRSTSIYRISENANIPKPYHLQEPVIMPQPSNGLVFMDFTDFIVDLNGKVVTGIRDAREGQLITVKAFDGTLTNSTQLINLSGSDIIGSDGLYVTYRFGSDNVATQVY